MADDSRFALAQGGTGDPTMSSLGVLDAEHVAVFHNALERILSAENTETTFSEIIDGLPLKGTWLEFDVWNKDHPVNVLGHDTLCDDTREKARRFRDEFDVYILSFPTTTLRDFQQANLGTRDYILSLIELLARSCHQIAARLFQLDDGFYKHSVYEAWRDAPLSDPRARGPRRPSAFCHRSYYFYEQYPYGIADVRREMYLHAGHHEAPLTLFPPTSDQFESLARYLLQPDAGPCPLPIVPSRRNGYRYHPHDAMSRFNIFRDRYERNEPPARSTHHSYKNGRNWPEVEYTFLLLDLESKRAQGIQIDEAELAEAQEGLRRITPSSPDWPH
ncbi:hypothetical protein Daus18300_011424 [Diaporthe australafricana]|uniref:Uncharacterized protein n=1 Tax=Diaporthe australafricana TaxID=127596 RepID=A0ABR3W6R9_9PEZI